MKKPIIPILVAVVLAIGAGVAVFLFASSSDSRAVADQQPVSIVVTTGEVTTGMTFGEAVDQGLLEQTEVPEKLAPASSVQSTAEVTASDVALADLPAGQVVLAGAFAAELPAAAPITVPEGLLAVSVFLEDPAKVGSFLRPGSKIAIFDTVKLPATTQGGQEVRQTRTLLDGVQVLAIGPTTEQQAKTATQDAWAATLVTVAVDQAQAEKLVHGIQDGALYMALLGENTALEPSAGVNNVNLFE